MANGNGASGEPLTRDVVQAVRVLEAPGGEESCAKSGTVHSMAQQETKPAKPMRLGLESMERTRLVMKISSKKCSNSCEEARRDPHIIAHMNILAYLFSPARSLPPTDDVLVYYAAQPVNSRTPRLPGPPLAFQAGGEGVS